MKIQSFLEKLSIELDRQYPQGFENLCIVFPTQRAGLFFKKHIAKKRKESVWAPEVFSIENFFASISGFEIPDNLSLVFELFSIFKKHFPDESFDNYYFWGTLLLNDFDEVDRSLANPKQLFKNVRELKEIDAEFGLSDEEIETIKKFWASVWNTEKEPSSIKSEFLRTWRVLYEIYSDYKQTLAAKNWIYSGMMYRQVAENFDSYSSQTDRWAKIIFAGLYDLSPAEEKFISKLVSTGKAECIWDSDEYYQDRNFMEAGKYFRNSKLITRNHLFKGNYFADFTKKIEMIGVSHPVAMAKAAGQIIHKQREGDNFVPEEHAFVLPDETLLLPVLHSIPDSIGKINVTMGYPLAATPLSSLFEILYSLNRNNRKGSFYHADVMNLLNHPYIQNLKDDRRLLRDWIKKCTQNGWIYLSSKNFKGDTVPSYFAHLFSHPKDSREIFSYLFSILNILRLSIKQKEKSAGNMEAEFIFQFYTSLARLEELFGQYPSEINPENTWKLFREIISGVRIPFTGEPLEGLQIMGFLESRALDFKNVYLFSMNEGVLPAPARMNSFIPFNIRKAFGLNTHEHQDSRYSYYFYRLLQRAENIYLFYNTSPKSISGGDKSRYLIQLDLELKKIYPDMVSVSKRVFSIPPHLLNKESIVIQKTDEILNSLKAVRWSASTLSAYINCPLQFYFKKIARLREQDEIEDNLDSAGFGNVFHKAMELIYKNEKVITVSVIDRLVPQIKDVVKKAFQLEFSGAQNGPEGRNLILVKAIEKLVEKVLDHDRADAPFSIFMAEMFSNFKLEINPIAGLADFTGKIDRVDDMNGYMRILDYKTGKTDFNKNTETEDLFSNPKHQILFQTFFYGLMISKNYPGRKIKLGIYPLKKISTGIIYPKKEFLQEEELLKFEDHLKLLMTEIYNKDIPFAQTEDTDRCQYCEFRGICNR